MSGLGDVAGGAGVALALTPRRDLAQDIHAHVRGAGDALLLARLLVVRPRLVVDPNYAAGLPLRRHVDSVADRSVTGHQTVTVRLTIDYQVTGHPDVESESRAAPKIDALTCRFPLLNTLKGDYMAVSQRLRYEILRRDNHACRYCGATAPGVKLNVDHVIPTSLGGSDKPDNLVSACAECNGGKTSSMPNAMTVQDVSQDAFRQAAELKPAAQPDKATVRIAFHAHLIAVWTWAWNKRSHTEPTEEQEAEAFEQLAILADGSDFTSDHLTQIAFEAGSARSTEPARFVGPGLTSEQFSLGADAVNFWWDAWEQSNQAKPSQDQTAEFCDGLHALVLLIDATAQRGMVMRAAARAGSRMDTNITRHLSAEQAQP